MKDVTRKPFEYVGTLSLRSKITLNEFFCDHQTFVVSCCSL